MRLIILILVCFIGEAGAEPLKIGVLAPLTGEMEIFGKKAIEGIELAFNQYPKGQLEFVVEDVGTGATAEVAKATSKLLSIDHVQAIIGAFYLDQTMVAAPIAEKAGVPLFSMTLCSPQLKPFKEVACGYPSTEEQLASFGWLLKQLGVKKIALLIENSSFGEDTLRVATSVLKQSSVEITANESINASERDFRSLISRVLRTKPDAIFSTTTDPGQSFAFFRQLKEQGYPGARIGYLDIDPKYIEEFGDSIEGVFLPGFLTCVYSPEFTILFQDHYHRAPDMYGALGYDLARLVAGGALNKTDSQKSLYHRVLDERLEQPAIPDYHFREDGTVSVPVHVLAIRNGKFVNLEN